MSDLHSTTPNTPLRGTAKDYTGQVFGRLTAKSRISGKRTKYLCVCSCGNSKTVDSSDLISGHIKSCGCLNLESLSARSKDLTGQTFERLKVVKRLGGKITKYLCLCSCGNSKAINGADLTSGNTRSCGCLALELLSVSKSTHGQRDSLEYTAWAGMWQRCTNSKHPKYSTYKDRTPPEEWRDFAVFLAHIGPKPGPEFSLDRIDNEKPYGPGNVRWATVKEQANNKSNIQRFTYAGKSQTAVQWAAETGLNLGTLRSRLNSGWSVEKALTTPSKGLPLF